MTLLTGEPRTNGYAERYAAASAKMNGNGTGTHSHPNPKTLLARFLASCKELESYKDGKLVLIDGHTLTIPAITAVARYNATPSLTTSPSALQKLAAARAVIDAKLSANKSIYGVSTGFGGSADTRTSDFNNLGNALLQHQHAGVLPVDTSNPYEVLPMSDPVASTSMPEAWVRAAMLVRMNSLVRGHSGVRYELIERIQKLLREEITPFVPLRGSISASGDLSPLSYVAGTIIGNPSIRVFDGPRLSGPRQIVPSTTALASHNLPPFPLLPKEQLGLLNGTAFSAALASLVLHDAALLSLLAQVCTAMGTEALLGTRASHAPFIHEVCRPHPGQVEAAGNMWGMLEGSGLAVDEGEEEEVTIQEDRGVLRQDRYPLRTSPQFIGPQLEVILHAMDTVSIEVNSTTDNPLIDTSTSTIHHGGNFQAMSLTTSLESTRLALFHLGKLLFAQLTELVNPAFNRGLPPSLAATDPSVNFFGKGVDIAAAAYVSELGWLAGPVGVHAQSAEMHNQAVNSLALISARATQSALEVLSMLVASYLLVLCQALDLRAMQVYFRRGVRGVVREEVGRAFGGYFEGAATSASATSANSTSNGASVNGHVNGVNGNGHVDGHVNGNGNGNGHVNGHVNGANANGSGGNARLQELEDRVVERVLEGVDAGSTMDGAARMGRACEGCTGVMFDFFVNGDVGVDASSGGGASSNGDAGGSASSNGASSAARANGNGDMMEAVGKIGEVRRRMGERMAGMLVELQYAFLEPFHDRDLKAKAEAKARANSMSASASASTSSTSSSTTTSSSSQSTSSTSQSTSAPSSHPTHLPPHPTLTPASPFLSPSTRAIYEYIRLELGIPMHGYENLRGFPEGMGREEGMGTVGGAVGVIYESVRGSWGGGDMGGSGQGKRRGMAEVVRGVFEGLQG